MTKMKDEMIEEQVQEKGETPFYGMITSINDAEKKLVQWNPDDKDLEDFPNYVINCLGEDPNIYGTADAYHNLASEFARKRLYKQAELVSTFGTMKYPFNVDLLADVVKFGSNTQDWDSCDDAYRELRSIDYSKWTWRTFTFVIDYLLVKLELPDTDSKAVNRDLKELIAQYKKLNDERAWVAESELLEKMGKQKEMIAVLKNGIATVNVAPQCCLKLTDVLLENGEYDDVIKFAAIGLRGTAQEQPSASIGYFTYVSALAKDALIHKEDFENSQQAQPGENKGFQNLAAVHDALLDYAIAKRLLQGRHIYLATIAQRELVLRFKSGIGLGKDDDSK